MGLMGPIYRPAGNPHNRQDRRAPRGLPIRPHLRPLVLLARPFRIRDRCRPPFPLRPAVPRPSPPPPVPARGSVMAQTYTLEEAANKLDLSVEEFKRRLRTEWTQIRSFR